MNKISLNEKLYKSKKTYNKSRTTETFIIDSIKVHGNRYDYSLVNYINSYTKVKIICPIHGVFEQKPNSHLRGQNCLKCINENQTKNKEQFIIDSIKVHSDKYNYSLVEYINNDIKVKIICPIHDVFEQKPSNHLSGFGCLKCKIDKTRSNINIILEKCNEKFNNKYKYDLDNYKNSKQKIKIICPIHGEFYQRIKDHIQSNGCPYCSGKKTNTEFYKNDCSMVHNNKYDYSLVEYKNAYSKVKIICPKHGIFEQLSYSHISGSGCPKCKSSKGEIKIQKYLDINNIQYEYQKTFKDCKSQTYLPFDFYLIKFNLCIEYDGEQHFRSIEYFGGENAYNNRIIRDQIKNEYCKNNNIRLIRISYIGINNIEKILKENINYE